MRSMLASLVVLAVSACGPQLTVVGEGNVTSVDRPVEGTKAVRLSVPGSLSVVVGEPLSLRMVAEGNLLPYLETTVAAGELIISVRPGVSLSPTRSMSFVLTAPLLRGLATESSGSISAPTLVATDFKLRVASSGSIHLAHLEAQTLDTQILSSGEVRVDEGKVTDQTLSIQSSGNYVASGLETVTATVHSSSSGDAWVWVTDRLVATLTSSGNVRYAGGPRVTANLTSSGTVEPIAQ